MEFPAIDPVLFTIPGLPIDVRWYGVTYIIGFFIGQWILVRLARAGFLPVDPKVAPDIIFYCVIGVMLGGRTGYALFYDQSLLNPLEFIKVWKGGLAFHGGLAGVAVACWFFARRHKIGWARVADSCSLAVTPGIFAVRMANFINGELYGRVTAKETFLAMQFPTDPVAHQAMHLPDLEMRDTELCIQVAFDKLPFDSIRDQLATHDLHGRAIQWDRVEPFLDWEKVREAVPYRHPSQLYEGFFEGIVLGLVLWAIYSLTRSKPWAPGRYTVVMFLGYALARGSLELVRQPDRQFAGDGTVLLGMTMGQALSGLLVLGAVLIWFWPRRTA